MPVEDSKLDSQIDKWLRSWDFSGNPFAYWEAEKEKELEGYYIKHPFYEDLIGSKRSRLIFAPRGGGKTATRIMLQRACQPIYLPSEILAVPFDNYSQIIEERYYEKKAIRFTDYLPLLIEETLVQIVARLIYIYRSDYNFPENQIRYITTWGRSFANHLFERHYLKDTAKRISKATNQQCLSGNKLEELADRMDKGEVFSHSKAGISQFWLGYLKLRKMLVEKEVGEVPHFRSSMDTIQYFFDQTLNFLSEEPYPVKRIIFLFDGIDEHTVTLGAPEISAQLIAPLLSEKSFLQRADEKVISMFFLPSEQSKAFKEVTRPRKLFEISSLDWKDQPEKGISMSKLLKRRVYQYAGFESLGNLCNSDLSRDIDDLMLNAAGNSPRNLILLGNILFREHCKNNPEVYSTISQDEFEQALKNFQDYYFSDSIAVIQDTTSQPTKAKNKEVSLTHTDHYLKINLHSQRVHVDDREINLTKMEFDFLAYLYKKREGICTNDELCERFYSGIPTESAMSSLRQLKKRLAKKLEAGTPKGYFIETSRGRGYMLINTRQQ